MFVDLIIVSLAVPLMALQYILSLVTFAIPVEVQTALSQLFGYVNYLNGYLPLWADPTASGLHRTVGIMTIFGWGLTIIILIQIFKVSLFVLRLIPFFNVKSSHRDVFKR